MKLKSYAKINLSLDITGIREDGYHEVATVMQRTSLCDIVDVEYDDIDSPLEIEVKTNRPYLPTDERNLAYKAALLMASKRSGDKEAKGRVRISIEKHIPVSAGLAGGSGNAAAVIILLNRLWNMKYDTRGLCEIGKELGADVAFCILTQNSRYRAALGTGVGEILTPLPSTFLKHLVLAKPSFGVSTREVYREIDKTEVKDRPDTDGLIEGLRKRDYNLIYVNMVNVLECYTLKQYPEVEKLKERLQLTEGVEKVLMSGSGPTVFAVYPSGKHARDVCMRMRQEGYEAYWTDTFEIKRRKND